jgi:hypothetical protein
MNSKELLEQAAAKAQRLISLTDDITGMEDVIPEIRDGELFIDGYDIYFGFQRHPARSNSKCITV